MPELYLSPSVQEYNPYVIGGSEEYYMNLVADAIEPYLLASGIEFDRNSPEMTLSQAIKDSNNSANDLHLAVHSNAAPEGSAGRYTGADIYYYPSSLNGKRFAEILQRNYENIYPYPDDVDIIPTTSLAEVRRTKAPSALIEVAYHDNPEEDGKTSECGHVDFSLGVIVHCGCCATYWSGSYLPPFGRRLIGNSSSASSSSSS